MCDTARISGAIPAMVGPKTPAGDYKYGGKRLTVAGCVESHDGLCRLLEVVYVALATRL